MKFYHRTEELKILNLNYQQAQDKARMAVITGRRRVGKTMLALKHAEGKPHVYLFVAKKAEYLLCQEFIKHIKQALGVSVAGEFNTFKEIFQLLLQLSKSKSFVVIIDEFQEFFNVNSSVYSELQALWDIFKAKSHMQVLFLGSVYSLMHKIFEDSGEPLFGRADRILHLQPFKPGECYSILKAHKQTSIQTWFNYYMFTGGMPKYIDMLLTHHAFNEKDIVDYILSRGSPLIDEGRMVLIEEFGKEYGTYFSILELISAGKTMRGEIESILQKNIGGHLKNLDSDYAVIRKFKPITSRPNSKRQKYHLRDHFLRFWFRFIYRNWTAIEADNFSYIKEIIKRDIQTYKGKLLESFYFDCFAESKKYNILGSYWERDGSNEIDLVAVNDIKKELVIAEIKINKRKNDLNILKSKAIKLISCYPDYNVKFLRLSLEDAKKWRKLL